MILWLCTACSLSEPAAGSLREDYTGLAERLLLPPNTAAVRWMTRAADAAGSGGGRADARVYAWVATPGGAASWLESTLGAAVGPRAHWVPDAVADVLFTPGELASLQRNEARGSWKLACVRYPGIGIGRGDFGSGMVLDCGDHMYATLAAR